MSGELFALQWEDIDFRRRTLRVQHTAEEVNGRVEITEPKTPKSRRAIDLDNETIAALKQRRSAGRKEGYGSDLVFPCGKGSVLRRSNFRKREFLPAVALAELPPLRFDDLRHTAATLMPVAGINAKIVSERLGDADVRITLDRYSHVLPSMGRDAANKVSDLLRSA